MSAEFEKGQIVKIIDGSEHLRDFTGEQGKVIGTIPAPPKDPFRVMVSLDGEGFINIRSEDLEIILDKELLGNGFSPDT